MVRQATRSGRRATGTIDEFHLVGKMGSQLSQQNIDELYLGAESCGARVIRMGAQPDGTLVVRFEDDRGNGRVVLNDGPTVSDLMRHIAQTCGVEQLPNQGERREEFPHRCPQTKQEWGIEILFDQDGIRIPGILAWD